MAPKVSVVMSVYNGECYLEQAVESILTQTFTDIEFIIIDDGSTDGTGEFLTGYATQDSRITIIRNEPNIGLTKSLNKGLALAQGKYIARMDADDISLPERLARQVHFLETQPEVGVLGTAIQGVDNAGKLHQTRLFPTTSAVLKWRLCFENPIAHPAVMMRREVVKQANGYNVEMTTSQDYDLWQRLSGVTRLSNLPEVLLYKRAHNNNVTYTQGDDQRQNAFKISQRMMSELLEEELPARLVKLLWARKYEKWKDAYQVAWLLYRLSWAVAAEPTWSSFEKQALRNHAAKKLFELFRPHARHIQAWQILGWVGCLDLRFVGQVATGKVWRSLRQSMH